jgi:hypothetical protein
LTGLVKKIDTFVRENQKASASAFVVLLGKPTDEEAKAKLKKVAREGKIEIPLTITADRDATTKTLKLNDKVKHTVLVYKGQKVVSNFALDKIEEKDVEAVLAAAKLAATS